MSHQPTASDGRRALSEHLAEKAVAARTRHGHPLDAECMLRILRDPEVVRYPTSLRFDAGVLRLGEFAHALPLGDHPRAGFALALHPFFERRRETWPLLIPYHIPPINYGDIVTPEDCERFGALLLGMEVEPYYQALCELADAIPGPSADAGSSR